MTDHIYTIHYIRGDRMEVMKTTDLHDATDRLIEEDCDIVEAYDETGQPYWLY